MKPEARRRVAVAALALGAYAACGDAPAEPQHTAFSDGPKLNVPDSQDTPESFGAPAPPRAPRARVARSQPRRSEVRGPATGDVWHALAECESGNTNDGGAPYYGYFQFSAATWRSMGHDGTADQYPYDVQLAAAQRLQARSGWGQWPVCSRKIGVR